MKAKRIIPLLLTVLLLCGPAWATENPLFEETLLGEALLEEPSLVEDTLVEETLEEAALEEDEIALLEESPVEFSQAPETVLLLEEPLEEMEEEAPVLLEEATPDMAPEPLEEDIQEDNPEDIQEDIVILVEDDDELELLGDPVDVTGDFKDPAFRQIIQEKIGQKTITRELCLKIKRLVAPGKDISSLDGISYLTKLKFLDVSDNNLTTLDLSTNIQLEVLRCYGNHELKTLTLPRTKTLTQIECSRCNIGKLDLTRVPGLQILSCHTNQLHDLDFSKSLAIQRINCAINPLGTLNLPNNPELRAVEAYYCQLTSLNLKGAPNLRALDLAENLFTSLSLKGFSKLEELTCQKNDLITLILEDLPALTYLKCSENELTTLNLRSVPSLNELDVRWNKIPKRSDIWMDYEPETYLFSPQDVTYTLDLSPKTLTIYLGLSGSKASLSVKSNGTVNFRSSKSSVASVSKKGVVTGKSKGEATIYAFVKEASNVRRECLVKVKKPSLVVPSTLTVKKGKTKAISYTVKPDGLPVFKSSDVRVAKVSKEGVVMGVRRGKATITVIYGITTRKITVKVK